MSLYLGTNLISGVATPIEGARNIGQIVQSTIPLSDAGLHLLDGALISGSGSYADFVDYIADLYTTDPAASYFAQSTPEIIPFVQPKLTANGTMGGDSFAVQAVSEYNSNYQAYMAFDNSTSSEWATAGTQNPSWITFYNPTPLNVTLITLRNRSTSSESFTAGAIYGSNDNSTWIELTTYTNSITASNATWTVNLNSNTAHYKYYKITGTSFSGTNNGFSDISITATEQGALLTPEEWWQNQITQYGVCGKFVYDSLNNTVRLPKITGFTEATIDPTVLGDLTKAGLPNIEGSFTTGVYTPDASGCFTNSSVSGSYEAGSYRTGTVNGKILNASLSNSIYGNSSTVQPQSIKVLYYIVLATSTKTQIEVDIDEVMTDLNGKADVDLSNCTKPHIVETYVNGTSWYRVYSDGWCEQGGMQTTNLTNNNATVLLLKTMSNTNYSIQISPLKASSSNSYNLCSYGDVTTSSFKIYAQGSIGSTQSWQACGYIN